MVGILWKQSSMTGIREPATPNSDIVCHVGRILPWLADMPRHRDLCWFTSENPTQPNTREFNDAVLGLARELRERREALATAISQMTTKLKAEIESAKPGTTMDPEGMATQTLEEAEEYFRRQCAELDSIRDALGVSGGATVHGEAVFEELEQLHRLFDSVVSWSQEVRWLMLINDGTSAATTGKTFTSGAELISALENSKIIGHIGT